jgi:hypothetical protein
MYTLKNEEDQGDSEINNLLWVDQLCIDQVNVLERSHQILLMKRTYRQAQNGLVWLGGEENFSKQHFK